MIKMTIPIKDLFIRRRIVKDKAIPNEQVLLQRGPIIEDGVTITIEDGGEFLIL